MRGSFRPVEAGPGAVTVEAFAALRALGQGAPEPVILGYHPPAIRNPFQGLLYGHARTRRIAPVPVLDVEGFDELIELARLGAQVVLHLHWLNKPLHGAADAAGAVASGQAFLDHLDRVQAGGVRTVWTVHNLLPHGARWPDQESWFRGEVARRVDLVHIMAARTRELVAPYFEIPADKVVHVPHPAYTGAYADSILPSAARHELGIMPDELVYLVLGAIQGYKGIGELLDAWESLPGDGVPRRLLIAGAPAREPGVVEAVERGILNPTVLVFPDRIEPDRMQVLLRAADIAVLPYLRSLNSGAQLLALTFGLPVIVPEGTGLADLVDPSMGRTFPAGDLDGMVRVLVEAAALATPAASAAALAVARQFDPGTVSEAFADVIRSRLFAGPVEEGSL